MTKRLLENFEGRKLALLTDFYELTMGQGMFKLGELNRRVVFDAFFRVIPDGGAYAVYAGLESIIEYVQNLHFHDEDIKYLHSTGLDYDFVEYLRNFKFSGNLYSLKEGSVMFPMEPVIRVEGNMIECLLMEAAILNLFNHQSLIATKAARVKYAAGKDVVMEFGLRRAQGIDAGVFGSRAALIGGCNSTSNTKTGKMFGVPIFGTHAHAWVQYFGDELTAFRKYAETNIDNLILLVDTYHILESGVPNAITVFNELKDAGKLPAKYGIRIDSGDLAYMAKKSRKLLDDAGFEDAIICVSSDLDENLMIDLKHFQSAPIDSWGVGTNLITSKDTPAFGGVYKLAAVANDDNILENRIKLSENPVKVTNPGKKEIFRFIDIASRKFIADVIALNHESIDPYKDYELFDPVYTYKRKILKAGTYFVEQLLVPIFMNGTLVYNIPDIAEVIEFAKEQRNSLWEETLRLKNPQEYFVDLSQELWNLKEDMKKNLK